MKLQNLVIIFLAIALPIIIILSVYVELQVSTAFLKARHDDALVNAAHETAIAFQINTVNNKFLTVSDTKIRDMEAALNIFSSSMSTSFGATGASKSSIMSYIPALMFTLYDGYYIYTPTKSWDTGTFSHELKTYVYYSKQYTNSLGTKTLSINYSLDNYVTVFYNDVNSYQSRAGYLEIVPKNKEEILADLLNDDAKNYYRNAWDFTEWFNGIVDSVNDETKLLKIGNNNSALPGVTSTFNDEKYEVIKDSITNNLIQAMYIYGRVSDHDFNMPKLTGDDWDTILNNACFIAFMQGIPVGTTVYNDYTIVTSSENKEVVNENLIYYLNIDNGGNSVANASYHRIWCPHLNANENIGRI